METAPRRALVREILDEAPAMTSRWFMSKYLTDEMLTRHAFTYPNRVMRKGDLDWWRKTLEVPDRTAVSLTLLNKALLVADRADEAGRYGDSIKALDFVRVLLGADLSTLEVEGESVYADMATGVRALFDQINKGDIVTSETDNQEQADGETGQEPEDGADRQAGGDASGVEGGEENDPPVGGGCG